METNVEMEYGSYNSIHSHLSNGSKIGNFSYSVGLGYDKSDGPSGGRQLLTGSMNLKLDVVRHEQT